MEDIEDQLNVRKRRLKQLSRRNEAIIGSSAAVKNIENSVESEQSLGKFNNEIISNTDKKRQLQEKSQDISDSSFYDETTMMRDALQVPLEELNRRTEEAIKRVVRQRLVSEAIHHE